MRDLNGKVAIVLGASTAGGMGEATARRLKAEGATVVVSGLGQGHLEKLAQELGGSAHEADITRETQLQGLVRHTLSKHGRLDIAVNVAGFMLPDKLRAPAANPPLILPTPDARSSAEWPP